MPVPLAHLGGGTLAPLEVLPLWIVAGAYFVRARTLRRRGTPVPWWRQLCYYGGLAVVLVALLSPLAHLATELFLAHMAEHLVIGDVATLLVVLGLTGPLLQPLLAIRWVDRLRVLANPAVALPLWMLNLAVWHLPALYQGTLTSEPLHALQHACFIGFGIAMWMALLGPLPKPAWFGNAAKLGYIVAVRLWGGLLANLFIWSGTAFYPDFAPGEREWGISPLADQGTAGVMMMIEGSIVTILLFAWVFLRAARETEERQDLLDYAEQHGLSLDEARARRAVEAGRGAWLRERLEAAQPR